MKSMTFKLDETMVNNLQRAAVEMDSRSFLVERMMKNNAEDATFLNSPIFNAYHDKYAESFLEFELMKEQISDQVIPESCRKQDLKWVVDYATGIMTVNVDDSCVIPEE